MVVLRVVSSFSSNFTMPWQTQQLTEEHNCHESSLISQYSFLQSTHLFLLFNSHVISEPATPSYPPITPYPHLHCFTQSPTCFLFPLIRSSPVYTGPVPLPSCQIVFCIMLSFPAFPAWFPSLLAWFPGLWFSTWSLLVKFAFLCWTAGIWPLPVYRINLLDIHILPDCLQVMFVGSCLFCVSDCNNNGANYVPTHYQLL